MIGMNRAAQEQLHGVAELVIVEGASHLFEEPGTMDEVTGHAESWFRRYLTR